MLILKVKKIRISIITLSLILYSFIGFLQAQKSHWILGNALVNSNNEQLPIKTGSLKFYDVKFNSSNTPDISERSLGQSIQNIRAGGVNEGLGIGYNKNGLPEFYCFIIGLDGFSVQMMDTLYIARKSSITGKDEIIYKTVTEGFGANSSRNINITQRPENENIFYIFYKTTATNKFQFNKIKCLELDLSSNTVVNTFEITSDDLNEGFAISAANCSGNKYFYYSKNFQNRTEIYSVEITKSGLSPSFLSFVLSNQNNESDGQGDLEISPDGTKMAFNYISTKNNANKDVYILDVDKSTGELSNPIIINNNITSTSLKGNSIGGIEFSPDSKRIYMTAGGIPNSDKSIFNIEVPNSNYELKPSDIIPNTENSGSFNLETNSNGDIVYLNGNNSMELNFIKNTNSGPQQNVLSKIAIEQWSASGVSSFLPDVQDGVDESNGITEGSITIKICDEADAIVNGVTYDTSGVYVQNLVNYLGCDSLLTITVEKSVAVKTEIVHSLCISNTITIGGITYGSPGVYTQVLSTTLGCDSTIRVVVLDCDADIYYDLEKCNALTGPMSMNYTEFTPVISNQLECAEIYANFIYRDNPNVNKHSCTQGNNNSITMCVSADKACELETITTAPITIQFSIVPKENKVGMQRISFYHKAPNNFNWINGPSGLNNAPTKFGVKIYRNNQLIYNVSNVNTTDNWEMWKLDFSDISNQFVVEDSTNFRVELLPYCAKGNAGQVSVWDVDDVSVFMGCIPEVEGLVKGKVDCQINEICPDALITLVTGYKKYTKKIESDGTFAFVLPDKRMSYSLQGHSDSIPLYQISTMDLVRIQKHILGLEQFTSPAQYVAADANKDGKVTSWDIVVLRKLMLGITDKFINNHSWVIVEKDALQYDWKNSYKIEYFGAQDQLRFVLIKVGDVTGAEQHMKNVND